MRRLFPRDFNKKQNELPDLYLNKQHSTEKTANDLHNNIAKCYILLTL